MRMACPITTGFLKTEDNACLNRRDENSPSIRRKERVAGKANKDSSFLCLTKSLTFALAKEVRKGLE